MSFPVPVFKYDPGSGVVTLSPTYPPIAKPGAEERVALRHDSVTISGYMQSITEHVEKFLTLDFPFVPMTDLAAWQLFIDYAILGGAFDYYPDFGGAPTVFQTYTLADTNWKSAFAFRTMAKITIRMRRVGSSS
jgi:hypothetical protein